MELEGYKQNPLALRTDPAVAAEAEAAKAMVQSAYQVALYNPRNEDEARARLKRACQRPEFAAVVEYKKPIGKGYVSGPSIRFTETALRLWRNVLTDIKVIYEDENVRRCKVFVLDLENNTGYSKEFQLHKTIERRDPKGREVLRQRVNTNGDTVYIIPAYEDELRSKENALVSMELRNLGLRLLPEDLTRECLSVAKATREARDAQDPEGAKRAVIDAFSAMNIFPKNLEAYIGHDLSILSPAEIDDLRAIYLALDSGETNWAEIMETKKAEDEKKEWKEAREEKQQAQAESQDEMAKTLKEKIAEIKKQEQEKAIQGAEEEKPKRGRKKKEEANAQDGSLFTDSEETKDATDPENEAGA